MKKVLKAALFATAFFTCGFIAQSVFITEPGYLQELIAGLRTDVDYLKKTDSLVSPIRWQADTAGVFTFCEADYKLNDWFFRERLQEQLWRLYDRRGWIYLQYERLGRYRALIERQLAIDALPRDLIYLYVWESGLDPTAKSWANAVGIPQFIKTAAQQFRLVVNSLYDERKDPVKSIEASCAYLRQLYDYFGDWLLAMASYNHGRNGVKSKMDQQQVSNYVDLALPTETYKYVFQIMAVRYVVAGGIMGDMSWLIPHAPLPESVCEFRRINRTMSLYSLSEDLAVDFDPFRLLNPHLPVRLSPGKYPVRLPL